MRSRDKPIAANAGKLFKLKDFAQFMRSSVGTEPCFLHFLLKLCTFEKMICVKADVRIESKVAASRVTFAEGKGMH